jgi:uncharacterized membrane protein
MMMWPSLVLSQVFETQFDDGFTQFGVSKNFLKQIEDNVKPWTSALAIIAANVTVDKVV